MNLEQLMKLEPDRNIWIASMQGKQVTKEPQAIENFPICFLSDPVPEPSDIDKVVFTIEGHDQGWCRAAHLKTPYELSPSWFEAMIVRKIELEGVSQMDLAIKEPQRQLTSELSVIVALKKLETDAANQGQAIETDPEKLCFACDDEAKIHSWRIQRNRRGNSEPKTHTITWHKEQFKSSSEHLGYDFDKRTGASAGVGFVKSLKQGDRIAIMARAKDSFTVNHVFKAEVAFYEPEPVKPASEASFVKPSRRRFKFPLLFGHFFGKRPPRHEYERCSSLDLKSTKF